MLDEFELLDERVQEKKLDPEIFNYLRSQMQHHAALSFILAGRHRLDQMTPRFKNIIFNVGSHQEVGFLKPEEAERLITKPVEPYGVSYAKECVDRILQLTAGHPYFIQRLCQGSVELLNKRKSGYIVTMDILKQAIEDSLKYDQILEDLWSSQLSAMDRVFFQTLATLVTEDDAWVSEAELLKNSELASAELAEVLQKSFAQRLIMYRQNPGQATEYAFGVDLLRLWIKNASPIQHVHG